MFVPGKLFFTRILAPGQHCKTPSKNENQPPPRRFNKRKQDEEHFSEHRVLFRKTILLYSPAKSHKEHRQRKGTPKEETRGTAFKKELFSSKWQWKKGHNLNADSDFETCIRLRRERVSLSAW
ncbi:hypothetical protein JTE90_006612 [Oedothorax gibbosus]|uniref:Uncharacterized protein n=1 Tax=Oedothorax gibbosus TaxID=931172 RepID=A0AAV6U6Y9_9ARAC|nr:hypothetical protein JTE90_006612 [Oedothorax gibbosus]